MSFADLEESRSLGEPDVLYRFTIGNAVYGYTDAEDAVTVNAVTYQPLPIDRDSVNTSGTMDKSALNIRMPHNTAIADLFRVFPPSEVVGLTIFQGHEGEFLAIWVGRVLSCKWEDSEAILSCEPVVTSMRRNGLRVRDQYQCVHALYGPACRAHRPDFTTTATVLSVSGSRVVLASGWNGDIAEARFANGILQWGTEQRQILAVNAANNRLRVGGVLNGLVAGMQVAVSRGCNHNMTDCNQFGNILNFGGAPFIPKTNPVSTKNSFF